VEVLFRGNLRNTRTTPLILGKSLGETLGKGHASPYRPTKNKNGTPCISKRFRYKRKIFKKSFGFPKGFPKAAINPRLSLV
jgi:hypothetical protein